MFEFVRIGDRVDGLDLAIAYVEGEHGHRARARTDDDSGTGVDIGEFHSQIVNRGSADSEQETGHLSAPWMG
ncbi:MAG: hypothetical protein QOE94_2850 [Mycobacterium sp.]|nr:hypothetical protein [Mycobacterium sp.]